MRPSRDLQPIAALASGQGPGAVAILRMSGEGCHKLVQPLLSRTQEFRARELHLISIIEPDSNRVIDEVMAAFFYAPKSYTGQESIEIYCHGGPYIVQSILRLMYQHGFRPAEPGEFTRRAFLNGKMDLTEAEGIRELVNAQTHQQWIAARHLASGRLKESIDALRVKLIEAMAYLEARIDFPDEGDTADVERADVRRRVKSVSTEVERLARSYDNGRVAAQGLRVALWGAPNAGKSTLMNSLLGRERAIVTEIAGTTRDYLEEPCLVDGRLIRLLDTAGVRQSSDVVERLGVEASLKLAREADVVLYLCAADSSEAERLELDRWVQDNDIQSKTLAILTKCDVARPAWAKQYAALSCKSGEGLDQLVKLLAQRVDSHVDELREETFVTSARHLHALKQAESALQCFFEADSAGQFEEMLAFELQRAARALADIIGAVDNEDILDKVFSEFCVGK